MEEHEELEDEEELEEDWEEPVWELGPEEGKDWRFNWLSDPDHLDLNFQGWYV